MERIVKTWAAIGEIGMRHATTQPQQKLLRLTNRIAFISIFITALQGVTFLNAGMYYIVCINAFLMACYSLCLLLSAYGNHRVARYLFLAVAAFGITHHHFYFGFYAGFWILLMNFCQAVFIFFSQGSTRRLATLSFLLTVVIGAMLVMSINLPPFFPEMTPTLQVKFLKGNLVRGPILFFIVAYYLVFENRRVEEELRFAASKAREAADAKSFFLSNISHELRTPMNAIKGFADILYDLTNSLGDEKRREQFTTHLGQIRISAANLTSIIDDILDFVRIESGSIAFRSKDFDLHDLAQNVMQTAEFYGHRSSGVDIVTELDPEVPRIVNGDPVRLSQILLNLLGNALKFTHNGHVRLHIQLKETSDRGFFLAFEVEDTGIGIPGEKLPYLFDRFSQISKETAVRYGGTGLGLAISKNLVEMQGGSIAVMSSPNKGSLFTVNLWFNKPTDTANLATDKQRDLKQKWILVAEDNEVNQILVRTLLESWNAKLEIVGDGLKALGRAQAENFDLILMDLQMPFMDGLEACENIRALEDPQKANIPIVALTADVLSETRNKVFAVGMNDIVTKPINQAELYATLRKALGLGE